MTRVHKLRIPAELDFVPRDNISIRYSKFGGDYYVDVYGPLGTPIGLEKFKTLPDALDWARREYGDD